MSGGKQHLRLSALLGLADTAELVAQVEAVFAEAGVGAVHVLADLGAVVAEGVALVDVHALLGVVGVHHVALVAQAQVPAAGEVVASEEKNIIIS